MTSAKLKRLEELDTESSAQLRRYEQLELRSPNDVESAELVRDIHRWLVECVALGRYLPTGSLERQGLWALIDSWNSRLRRDGHRLTGIDDLAPFDSTAGVVLDAEPPYPGLDAYRADKASSFFGRGALSERYSAFLLRAGIFLIIGASGSGKSSLALAGIRPRLQNEHPEWLYPDDFTPGTAPIHALAASVAALVGKPEAAEELAQALRDNPASAPDRLRQLYDGRSLLLLVDQFEELITLCRDPREQAAFAAILVALSDPPRMSDGWSCCTLLTLRSDHLARFESSNDLKPLYVRLIDEHNFDYLPGLNFDDIKRAIAEPAKSAGLRFVPPTIVDRLASETAGLANGLPLLQFSLRRLWDTRPTDPESGKPLDLVTQSMVDALPDVRRALGTVAEGIFAKLTPRQQEICARALQELVLLDENFEEPLRRRRNRAELMRVLEDRFPGSGADIAEVERQFTEAGLLRVFGEGDGAQMEVAHEALLRHWERIRQALSGSEAKQRLHAVKQIGREAAEWRANGGREDFLKQHGEPLRMACIYRDQGWLADAETMAYLQACVEREKAADARAKELETTKQREQEAREAARREKIRRKQFAWGSAASAVIAAVVIGLLAYAIKAEREVAQTQQNVAKTQRDAAKAQRDAGLTTITSLGDRLLPWDGLDLAYKVAKDGGPDYRFALGHAVERMDDAWVLGKRDAPLFLVGGGSALLQFDRSGASQKLLVYFVAADGRPDEKPIVVDLGTTSDALAQAQVGPEIKAGPHTGRRVLLLASIATSGDRSYRIAGHLLGGRSPTPSPLRLSVDGSVRQKADELSPIRFHADGLHAIWSMTDYRALNSQVQEFTLESDDAALIRPASGPGGVPLTRASSIAYRSGGTSRDVIVGALDGSILCGNRKLKLNDSNLGPNDPRRFDQSPLRTIVTHPEDDVFAAIRFSGQVLAGSCAAGAFHLFQLLSSDPGSLQLSPVHERGDARAPSWVVSYFDGDRQLRCYAFDPATSTDRWWLCNAAHLLGASVQLTDKGQQLVIERSDVAVVRRYPNEQLSRKGRQANVRVAKGTALRWVSQSIGSDKLNAGTSSPWAIEDGDLVATEGRQIEAAAVSPNGQHVAWIERLRTTDYSAAVPSIKDPKLQETVSLVRSMAYGTGALDKLPVPQEGFAQAVAIDDAGRLAYVEAIPGGAGATVKFSQGGRPVQLGLQAGQVQCLGYSPGGKYLIVGTAGGALRRIDTGLLDAAPTVLSRNKQEAQEGRAKVSVTACAVAEDGAAAAGYLDGQIVHFMTDGTALPLTERIVYSFTVPIKDISIEPPGTPRHVTALGEWQINNCIQAGLPGQTIRAWDTTLPEAMRTTPVAVACFPNASIAALGSWGLKKESDSSDGCPAEGNDGNATDSMRSGICLVTGSGERRWHVCPTCGTAQETAGSQLAKSIRMSVDKKVRDLSNDELERRYGFKL